ncbi:MAG: Sec-independent protein translocase subunit TatA [Gammaproteobacteria bacterium]|nr:Sec-independent protein translocase subunit TatA [Gammaproteobacteria bacterium]
MGFSPWQLLIILVIVVLIFGTKKLRNMGGDLGGALKNFKDAVKDEDKKAEDSPEAVEKQDAQFSEKNTEENSEQESPVERK